MSPPRLDLTGQKCGRLLVLAMLFDTGRSQVQCLCDCGAEVTLATRHVRTGATQSCGCLSSERSSERAKARIKHGQAHSRTYTSWQAAKNRCHAPTSKDYPRWGAKGIVMCDRWRESFEAFLADMGERPAGKTLDRWPNPLGNYEPGNCRWATPTEQSRNSRSVKASPEVVGAIRARHAAGERAKDLALEFGLHWVTVHEIIRRETWKDV